MKGPIFAQPRSLWSQLETARSTLLASDPNRLISFGRFMTVAFAVLAIWLDPTQPYLYHTEVHYLLTFYLGYSALMLLAPSRRRVDSPAHLFSHVFDTVIFGCLALLTNELTSPFFVFLPFTLMAMTMRWGLGGAILGAFFLELVLYAIGIPDILDGESEVNLLVVRSAFLLLAALMLGYFGAYRESSRQRLTRLARWPLEPALGSRRTWLKELCLHAGSVIGSKHIIVVWHEHETDQAFLASWQTPDLDLRELSAALSSAEIDAAISGAYDCTTARVLRDGEVQAVAHALTRLGLPEVLSSSFVVSAGFSGLRLGGAVLLLEPNCRWEEAVALSEIIATRIGAELERLDLIARHSDDVRAAERNRLAQDLHDSVLQDLTATSLRLHALGAVTPADAERLREIEKLVLEQQRRIRRFVEDHRDTAVDTRVEVAEELRAHAGELSRMWEVAVRFDWRGGSMLLPRRLVYDLMQLLSEATSNAVRHGAASSVHLSARMRGGAIELTVVDDGSGLDPRCDGTGSVSLRARMHHLGGAMSLSDQAPGLAVRLVVPVEELAA
ncbi:histidine kinase [Novosphingobium sp. HII-3]|uniref:sensor histidine kinase n=1 Tax=Novosphingobium sp. HII-3 TaxID=2075565 RepID=UPI000CDAAC01|nr:histidine kinase [Novosphingobium sp. HII-3]